MGFPVLALVAAAGLSGAPPAIALDAGLAEVDRLYADGRLMESAAAARDLLRRVDHSFGKETPEAARVLPHLVKPLCWGGAGDSPETLALADRGVAVAERLPGPPSDLLAANLRALVELLAYRGDFGRGRVVADRLLLLLETAHGRESREVADALSMLSALYSHGGDEAGALIALERSLAIWERAGSALDLSGTLTALSQRYRKAGQLERARALAERGLEILAAVPEAERLLREPAARDILGDALRDLGDFVGAETQASRAVSMWEARLGPDDFYGVARGLAGLALAQAKLGRAVEARANAERALRNAERALGPGHWLTTFQVGILANVLLLTGDVAAAEPLYERALAIEQATWGPRHRRSIDTLLGLAEVERRLGKADEALDHALQAEAIARELFRTLGSVLSEAEVLGWERARVSGLGVACATVVNGPGGIRGPGARRLWDGIVRSRGLGQDEVADRHRAERTDHEAGLAPLVAALRASRARLSALQVRRLDSAAADATRAALVRTEAERDRLERDLARRTRAARSHGERGAIGFADVDGAIPDDAALVAFVRYAPAPAEAAYLALVRSAHTDRVVPVPLGAAAEIDARIERLSAEVDAPPRGLGVEGGAAEHAYREAGARVRELLWDPVAPAVGDAELVFIVPDGAIQAVSLATLPIADDRYLADTGPQFHYLSTERDLVRRRRGSDGRDLLIVGAPDFDASPRVDGGVRLSAGSVGSRGPQLEDRPSALQHFNALVGAAAETGAVAGIWGARSGGEVVELSGAAAGEAAFKQLAPRHSNLHLATHAFLAAEPRESAAEARSVTGLAFAGANLREPAGWRGEDGILTVEEIACLDLSGVRWAVLSGCQTGVGATGVDGIQGLRRAFEIAGAGTLIASLWNVDDAAAQRWMSQLYEARLAGRGAPEAVAEAHRALLASRRAAGQTTHPYYWGAFVSAGDWR